MRIVKVDNNKTVNNTVPKKASPIKKTIINNGQNTLLRKSAGNKTETAPVQPVYFKDLETINNPQITNNKGKEVRSLTTYYESLNKSLNSKSALLASQSSTSLAITKKKASLKSASPTKVQQIQPLQQESQLMMVEVVQPIAPSSSAETTPIQSLSPKRKSVNETTLAPVTVAAVAPVVVPKEVETIRETVEVYRTKIMELEKTLEREKLQSKSLRQELMILNEHHTREIETMNREIDEKDEKVKELYDEIETKDYSLLDFDSLKETSDSKDSIIERLEEEIHEAEECAYVLRKEQESDRRLIEDYKKELLDCQTLVAYYQEEFGKKCNEFSDLQRRFAAQSDELKQYKNKIQAFLQLLDSQEKLKDQLVSPSKPQQQQQQTSQPTQQTMINHTPKKENSSAYFNSSNQTPVSAKKKPSSITMATTNSNNNSVFKSPNPLSKQRTPKKVLASPRSIMEYI